MRALDFDEIKMGSRAKRMKSWKLFVERGRHVAQRSIPLCYALTSAKELYLYYLLYILSLLLAYGLFLLKKAMPLITPAQGLMSAEDTARKDEIITAMREKENDPLFTLLQKKDVVLYWFW